ncbi:Crp/Fnr family transcriptional regulator [Myroides fluvii]|uniref:Crp/Fnr family transcriptional regulator n=1 Tax=Myroides fluvii TaxID=2572594 RepID=UPI00131BB312|nr:Crp/Fnr family transcriptional regulator [Myroides fluvii]
MTKTTLFIEHIEQFTRKLSSSEIASIVSFVSFQSTAKKTNLQEAGGLCESIYFVLCGCLRSYYIKENGTEQTLDFAIEKWWLTDNLAFANHSASNFWIQTVESSDIVSISSTNFTSLLAAHPVVETYFRIMFQKAHGAAQYRLKLLYEYSREELYFHFEEQFPSFVQRIPQYLLASYLGFSPEYLSEIKKKRFS